MPLLPHKEARFTASEIVRDIVIGMSDGLTVPFALAAGLTGVVRLHGVLVTGYDSLTDGEGRMQWNILSVVPMAAAKGTDVTRSAIGRLQGKAIWLPSMLCGRNVVWTAPDASMPMPALRYAAKKRNWL